MEPIAMKLTPPRTFLGFASLAPLRETNNSRQGAKLAKTCIGDNGSVCIRRLRGALAVLALVCFPLPASQLAVAEPLRINVTDSNGEPLPCRVHLRNENGEPQRVPGQPYWNDHFVCSGRVTADLKPGEYRYEIERGPEHERKVGKIAIDSGKPAELKETLRRIANLRQDRWFSADLHVHRPLEDVELLMRAEDLDFAPVITWWNNRNLWQGRTIPDDLTRSFDVHRLYGLMAGEDEREGGALLFFGLDRPLDITGSKREVPSPMQFVTEARKRNEKVWIDIEKPFWWDVPVWLADGRMNSIGLANNHMCRSRMLENEAWGKPRDVSRLPSPRGNGFWTQEIYYHILNSGLRIPPSAGSASGVLPNPVGYNRVYVHLDEPFTRDAWFAGLARGRCFVTNGPLLVVRSNRQLPGATLKVDDGTSLEVQLEIELTSIDRVPRLELIYNGEATQSIECSGDVSQKRSLQFKVDRPGWFLVRAIADVNETFRFASTAPWFVETEANQRHISRLSAQFFHDWTVERIDRAKANVPDESERREVLAWHEKALAFWQDRVKQANAP
jgi:hypothetical protein